MFRTSLFTSVLLGLGLSMGCATTAPPHPEHAEHARQAQLSAEAERTRREEAELAHVEREVMVREEIEAVCRQDGAACETLRKREVLRVCAHENAACDIRELMLGPSAPAVNQDQHNQENMGLTADGGAVGPVATAE